jgi:hypothetical protein
MSEESGRTLIYDTRAVAPQRKVTLEGLLHRVHRQLDSASRPATVVKAVNEDGGEAVEAAGVEAALAELVARKLVLRFGDRHLALAVSGDLPWLPKQNEDGYPGGWIDRRRRLPHYGSQVAWADPSPASVHQAANVLSPVEP